MSIAKHPVNRSPDSSSGGSLREEMEPSFELGPAPVIFMVALGVLIYWAMIYLDRHSGGFNLKVYEPYASLKQLEGIRPPTPERVGKILFNGNCAVCHQATGLGQPEVYPPLAGSDWVLAASPNRLIRIVLNGLQGPIKVNNVDFPTSQTMFPFDDLLSKDEQVAAVLTYIRSAWGNQAPPVTAEQVKAIRAKVKGHAQWTAAELLAISDSDETK